MPTLGICYGMQLMARDLGGEVESNDVSEYGKAELEAEESALFRDLPVRADGLDEPPRLGHGAAGRRARRRPLAVDADRRLRGSTSASSTASSSTPRSSTRRTARRS